MQFSNVTTTDSGTYICRAINVAGTGTAIVSLAVHGVCVCVCGCITLFSPSYSFLVPPSVSLPASLNITRGATVMLDCQPAGFPTPSVMWYKDEILLVSTDHVIVSNGTVTIEDAYTTDSGIYTCVAVNVVDNASASTVLDVRSKFCL